MQIAGHKTRAIFDWYNITNKEGIRAGQLKTERHVQTGDNRVAQSGNRRTEGLEDNSPKPLFCMYPLGDSNTRPSD